MELDLRGKNALVAGSTGGIGRAAALELATMGANVILLARNEESLIAVQKLLDTSKGNSHRFVVADFTDREQVMRAGKEALDIANGVIHILVNNTGGPPGGPLIDAEPQAFDRAFGMHLIGNHILTQLLVPGMKKARYGRIVNVISTSVKQPLPNLGVSNTIRGAVGNWSKTLAGELGVHGITVNNVLPGPTLTNRLRELARKKAEATGRKTEEIINEMGEETPINRVAQPEEIANAIAFLASPAASYINGINLPVDGGRTKSL